jgi:two-component system chemotaxis response regulator CheB
MIATEQQRGCSAYGQNMAFDVVVLAVSLGGVKVLSRIVSDLPADFPLAIVVAHHLCPDQRSYMPEILRAHTALRVKQAQDGDVLLPATVYTSAPGRHLQVERGGILSVFRAPRVQFVRPSADILFQSVASSFGDRSIAVVLTGTGREGAKGIQAIRKAGGFVIAQDEATAEHFDMPSAAIETRKVDLVLPLCHIGFALRVLAGMREDHYAAAIQGEVPSGPLPE